MTEHQQGTSWNAAEWHGKMPVDRDGERIGKLQDVYVNYTPPNTENGRRLARR